jgi:hypothetical protein
VVAGVTVSFEQHRIPYTQPEKARNYTPDFVLPNGIVIESKGLFTQEDRAKMVWVKDQHPTSTSARVLQRQGQAPQGLPDDLRHVGRQAGLPVGAQGYPSRVDR